jgi:protein tyrosine/serine phosphatase
MCVAFSAMLNSILASDGLASDPHSQFPGIGIKNFGKMDDYLYRGGQPKEEEYRRLASFGVKTVIDLRDDPKSYARSATEAAGMEYINIPMSDTRRPTDEQIKAFLGAIENAARGPFFVHCAGGRHRTGVAGAVYRLSNHGWDYERAYKEMKDYDFYSRWGHGALKDFVIDYFERATTQTER